MLRIKTIESWLNRTKNTSGCLIYQGSLTGGYAKSDRYIHRELWQAAYGAITNKDKDGRLYVLDHLCRNRNCINIKHLELVTHAENIKRGFSANKLSCVNGHKLEGKNLGNNIVSGHRYCIVCNRVSKRNYMRRLRNSGNNQDSDKDS